MDRRIFLSASAAGLVSGSAAAERKPANQYFELRFYQLRNSKANQRTRLTEFLEKHHLPMTNRHGIGPAGYFQVDLGANMPKVVTLTAYKSWAAIAEKRAAREQDKSWVQAVEALGSGEPAYDRAETWLLKAFDGMPKLEAPSVGPGKEPRFFDLRTYEAETHRDSLEKIKMFNTEEIAIFRRCGINPVFFGQTLFGSRLPNLTYLVWYDDREAREAAWAKFREDPDWLRIRVRPGWSDAEIVSNITNTFLRPLPFSPIR